jgi:hypothetical protein
LTFFWLVCFYHTEFLFGVINFLLVVQRDGQNYYRVSRFLICTKVVCSSVEECETKKAFPSHPISKATRVELSLRKRQRRIESITITRLVIYKCGVCVKSGFKR